MSFCFFQKVSYKVGNVFKEFLLSDIKDLVSIGNLFDTSFNFEFKDLLFIYPTIKSIRIFNELGIIIVMQNHKKTCEGNTKNEIF